MNEVRKRFEEMCARHEVHDRREREKSRIMEPYFHAMNAALDALECRGIEPKEVVFSPDVFEFVNRIEGSTVTSVFGLPLRVESGLEPDTIFAR